MFYFIQVFIIVKERLTEFLKLYGPFEWIGAFVFASS